MGVRLAATGYCEARRVSVSELTASGRALVRVLGRRVGAAGGTRVCVCVCVWSGAWHITRGARGV